ncbi:MAG: hypothetical protein R3F43_32835 [bacterium]
MAHDAPAGRGRLLASTLPALLLLSGVIVYSTFVLVYSQLSSLAESWYPGYHQLREEPAPPDCDATAAPAAAPPSEAPAAEGMTSWATCWGTSRSTPGQPPRPPRQPASGVRSAGTSTRASWSGARTG